MGITESVSHRRVPTDLSGGTLVVVAVVVYLFVDLTVKLTGTSVFAFGVRIVGGSLTVGSLLSMVFDGLLVGLAVGLAGIGLSMTYSILDFANFAHGDTVTVGAFLGWVAAYIFAGLGTGAALSELFLFDTGQQLSVVSSFLPVLVGLLVAGGGTVGVSLLVDRLTYRPMREADNISLLIASIGVALTLRYLMAFVFGTQASGVASGGAKFQLVPGLSVTDNELALLVVSAVLMIGVHFLLQRTKLGKAMRAMADNEDLARVTGIPTERVIRMTWVLGGALAGIGGYLLVLESGTIIFNFGWILLLLIFAAVILGGIGSIYGAMAGGIVIGLVDNLALIWLDSGLTRAAAFAVLIAVLLLRPSGIFSGVSTA